MRIDRAVVVAFSILVICLAGGAFALAQETEQPESDDETTQSGDETTQSDDEATQSGDEPSTTWPGKRRRSDGSACSGC